MGYAGSAEFVANLIINFPWIKAYGSPTQEAGYFLAAIAEVPENLLCSGSEPWNRMQLDDLLDFC